MIPNIMRGYASKNRKNYGEALEKFNAVQQSLLSGAETVKVCFYRNIIKVGGLLVAVQLAEVLAAPAETLAYLLNAKNEARPLVEKYEQLAETEEDRGKTDINDIEDICVEHLSYGRNGVKIIKDVSFTFEKGRKYMLTGSSGSGKSTFLRLIGKLQEGTYQGNIRINGILLEEINMDSLYGKMGIVFQEPYLFGFSLKENIIMGRN